MFGITQEELISALIRLQRYQCAYDGYRNNHNCRPPKICDCKYGADHLESTDEAGNGCPELRSAIWLLSAMTPEEYAEITKRGHIQVINHSRKGE